MSVSTGRMSRADAQHLLSQVQPALREFSTPDASPETLSEVADCSALRAQLQDSIDRGHAPDAAAIRSLRTRVAALQADRLANSESLPYRATLAAVITLYGISGNNQDTAAVLAARKLNTDCTQIRLQDVSHVRTATLTGTRYIFTTHTP